MRDYAELARELHKVKYNLKLYLSESRLTVDKAAAALDHLSAENARLREAASLTVAKFDALDQMEAAIIPALGINQLRATLQQGDKK